MGVGSVRQRVARGFWWCGGWAGILTDGRWVSVGCVRNHDPGASGVWGVCGGVKPKLRTLRALHRWHKGLAVL